MIKITAVTGELKEHRMILSRLQQALHDKEFSLIVIFPTLSLLNAIQSEFLRQPEVTGCGGFRFLLFEGFVQEVSQRFELKQSKPSQLEREILISECFRGLTREGRLAYLNRIPYNSGYRRAILDGIDEWTRSGLTPDSFMNWASSIGDEKERQARVGEFALIYKTYKDMIMQKGLGEEDQILSDLLDLKTKGTGGTSKVLLYGFTDLTPLQSRFLEALAPRFDFEMLIDPTTVVEFQEFITRRFETTGTITSLPLRQVSPTNMLTVLQQWFWTREPESQDIDPADESVRLFHTAGLGKAARAIAREIAGLLRGNPEYSIDDFLVLAPQTSGFIRRAAPVFFEYGLPVNAAAVPLREFPGIKRLLQSFIVCANDWPWPEMEILIRQYYHGELASMWDRLILAIGERYGALSGRERWQSLIRNDDLKVYFAESGWDLSPLLEGISRLMAIPDNALLKDYLKIVREWYERVADETGAGGILNLNDDAIQLQLDDLCAVQALRRSTDDLLAVLEVSAEFQTAIDIDEFIQFLKEYILAEEITSTARPSGQVLKIIPPQEARGLNARFVFITGLEQGTFPRLYVDDWKLTARDRHELRRLGIGMETGEQYQFQERMVFYWTLQTATMRLYLVNQDQDENGQPLTGSIFLDEVLQWFPCLKERAGRYSLAPQLPNRFEECLSGFEARSLFAYQITHNHETASAAEQTCFQATLRMPVFQRLASQVFGWRRATLGQGEPGQSYFSDKPDALELINQIFHEDFIFSITALEDYLACPFRFFIKHLLKVRSIMKPQLMPEGLQLGNLYHQILQDFGEIFRDESFSPDRIPEYREVLNDCFNGYYREWQERAANDLVRLVLLIQENLIRQTLERWLASELQWADESQARFKIAYLELAFGLVKGDYDAASIPRPYQLEKDGVKMKLWGKIDRVDVDEQGNFIVYDYKSSRGPALRDLLAFKHLQIPVYLMALEQLIFGTGKAVGGCYLGLREPSRSRSGIWSQSKISPPLSGKGVLTENEWREWHLAVESQLTDIVQSIRRGEFGLTAEECSRYCEYIRICRHQEREAERFDITSVE